MSIVRLSELPGCASLIVWRTWSLRPVASRSTLSVAVDAAQLGPRSTPRARSCRGGRPAGSPRSAGRRAARPRPDPCSRGSATAAGRRCTGGGPRRRPRRPAGRIRPRRSGCAVSSWTSPAIRTRSKREPGLPSIVALISAASMSEEGRQAARRPRRGAASGRSAGRTLTAKVGTFVTRTAPIRS